MLFVVDIRDKRRKLSVGSGPCIQYIHIFVSFVKNYGSSKHQENFSNVAFSDWVSLSFAPLHGFCHHLAFSVFPRLGKQKAHFHYNQNSGSTHSGIGFLFYIRTLKISWKKSRNFAAWLFVGSLFTFRCATNSYILYKLGEGKEVFGHLFCLTSVDMYLISLTIPHVFAFY